MSILIVEDNPVNARLLALMLQEQGYQTVTVENGKEALKKVSEIPDIQLIITDYLMPEMDGLEFIVKVRALPTFNHAPILVASAHGDLETVKRVQDLRCGGFLLKPIDKRQLIKRVEQLLQSQSHVLLGKNKAMEKMGIGPSEYHDLIKAFEAQLAAIVPIVVLEQGDSGEPISQSLGQLLTELIESASILGADKFVLLFSKSMGPTLPVRSQCPELLVLLQELERDLSAYGQSQLNTAPRK
ncbi:MAG: response regulator [Nitrospira sp.]|nr:MAG: response regulator [Nitrospira sp.]